MSSVQGVDDGVGYGVAGYSESGTGVYGQGYHGVAGQSDTGAAL
jgi:hypothetical protein